jgi:hypothetical protein
MSIWLKALAVFIFNNRGPDEVLPLAALLLALWGVAALFYIAVIEQPKLPRFFGVRRGRWGYDSRAHIISQLPYKWRP